MWVFCLHVSLPTTCSARADQKRALYPLELELQSLVSCHVCWKSHPGPLQERLALLAIEPSLQLRFLKLKVFVLFPQYLSSSRTWELMGSR